MTREEAELLQEWLSALAETGNLWSCTVDTVRQAKPDDPIRYRVILERIGDPHPVAIYRARILTRALSTAGKRTGAVENDSGV